MAKTRNYEIKSTGSIDGIVKDVDTQSRIVTGYFAKFGNIDSDNDIIRSGAAKKSIQENGPKALKPRIKHLWQHDPTQPLSTPQVLKEDEYGIYFESKIAPTTLGNDVLTLYQEGVINEHSIGFNVIDAFNNDDNVRVITEIRLWEGSSVTWGANSDTPFVGFKSMEDPNTYMKKLRAIKKILHGESISDETGYLLEIWLNQMESAHKQLASSADDTDQEAVEVQSQPQESEQDLTLEVVKQSLDSYFQKKMIQDTFQRINKIKNG
jgi:uncharacterized protein